MRNKLPKLFTFKQGTLLCPKCKSEIRWSCPSEPGARGRATCVNSISAYRVISARDLDMDKMFCDWRAETIRLTDGDVGIIL